MEVKENPFVKWRKERIEAVLKFIKEKNPASLSEVIGHFGLEYGITEKTIMGYLNLLEGANKIKIDHTGNTVTAVE